MDDRSAAFEELSMLQAIIARQDDFKAKAKTLAVALLSAISVGYFSGQVPLAPHQYFLASVAICAVFMLLEGAYGVTEINAESRVKRIESFLTTSGATYDGPQISMSLLKPVESSSLLESMLRWRTLIFYAFLAILVLLAAYFVTPATNTSDVEDVVIVEIEAELIDLKRAVDSLNTALRDTSDDVATLRREVAASLESMSSKLSSLVASSKEAESTVGPL